MAKKDLNVAQLKHFSFDRDFDTMPKNLEMI